ncbi:Sex-determining protein fem-1 [Nymphon striatum]|nr:Sex-determining protein fem-1 [Nymphon striatum]
MNKHNTFSTMLHGAFLILSGIILSSTATAQQTVLLDANGEPISDEVLMLLSSSSGRLNPPKPSKKVVEKAEKSKAPKKPKRNKPPSNPLLEIELFNALKEGRTQRAKQLLKIGTSPTHKSLEGETPLGIAVSRGWASMVIELIENGADVNEKGARGVTLLHIASAKGLIDVAKVLVKHGLKPGQKTDKNWTATSRCSTLWTLAS